jgi:putative monooxygenase
MSGVRTLKVPACGVPASTQRGGEIRITLSPRTVGATSGFGGVLTLEPGKAIIEHYHPYSEEFIHLIAGEAHFFVDGDRIPLGPGDSLLVPIGARHRMVNVGGVRVHAVFHLSPLAPLPALGHVDLEPAAGVSVPLRDGGGGG